MEGQQHYLIGPLKKSILWYVVILAAVVISFFVFQYLGLNNRVLASEFRGNIEKVEGNTLYLKGKFYVTFSKNADTSKPEDTREVQVVVGSKTVITRITAMIPSAADLKKTNGVFDLTKVPSKSENVTVADLAQLGTKQNVILDVVADGNIYHDSKFTASTITYTVLDSSLLRSTTK